MIVTFAKIAIWACVLFFALAVIVGVGGYVSTPPGCPSNHAHACPNSIPYGP